MIGDLETFMSWADEIRSLKVMANADTPEDAVTARNNGAQGIELCRMEHMFFASDERIKAVRKMIMAVTAEQRKAALNQLLPYSVLWMVGICGEHGREPSSVAFFAEAELDYVSCSSLL